MVKKVQYKLIDEKTLPVELICKGNAYNELVGIDDSFTNEWLRITTELSTITSGLTKDTPMGLKTNLYLSYMNHCGLILAEDPSNCCSTSGCKC